MSYSDVERLKIKRMLGELKRKRGRGTELISLYIPAGRPIADVMSVLREEYSTATNIKDRTTRHHVLDALTAVMQRLKLFRTTPPNGLVIFAGYVSEDETPGNEKMEVHVIEPPEKLNVWLYRCDSRFWTEILEKMVEVHEVYGLMVVDRSEAAFALLKGPTLQIVKEITSGIPGKHRAGGQSARRFERIRIQLVHEFYKRVGEHANKIFLEVENLRGIVVGGPGPAKNEFLKGDYLHYTLKEKILGVFDIGYSGEEGIYELAERAKEVIRDVQYVKEREAYNQFLYHISRDTGLALYGEEEVRRALTMGAVDTLLISEGYTKKKVKGVCPSCHKEVTLEIKEHDVPKCPFCGAPIKVEEEKLVLEELVEEAKQYSTKIVLFSTNSDVGKSFLKIFGGIAAVLRYKI
ncbi:MAG: peptide chain release factor 1 [Thermoprotei archaeon]|nr:MAG: peptide chain release factor 1 [Thermoprotei archaeon]